MAKTNSSNRFTSKQLLLFVFSRRSVCQYSMAEDNLAAQRQTAVTAYFTSLPCAAKTNSSNCLLKKLAVTVVCLCTTFIMPVLDGRRECCSSKTNSSKAVAAVYFCHTSKTNSSNFACCLSLAWGAWPHYKSASRLMLQVNVQEEKSQRNCSANKLDDQRHRRRALTGETFTWRIRHVLAAQSIGFQQ